MNLLRIGHDDDHHWPVILLTTHYLRRNISEAVANAMCIGFFAPLQVGSARIIDSIRMGLRDAKSLPLGFYIEEGMPAVPESELRSKCYWPIFASISKYRLTIKAFRVAQWFSKHKRMCKRCKGIRGF